MVAAALALSRQKVEVAVVGAAAVDVGVAVAVVAVHTANVAYVSASFCVDGSVGSLGSAGLAEVGVAACFATHPVGSVRVACSGVFCDTVRWYAVRHIVGGRVGVARLFDRRNATWDCAP